MRQTSDSDNDSNSVGIEECSSDEMTDLNVSIKTAETDPDAKEESITKTPKTLTQRLLGGTFHYGIGQSLPQVIRFLLTPVFAYFLTPADYGVIELASTFGAFLVIFMRLGVPGAVTRFYYDHREGPELHDYITTIAIFLLGSSVVVALLTTLTGPWVVPWLIPGLPFYPIGLLVILTSTLSCNQNLQDRLVQAREQSSYAAKLNLGRATISTSLTLLLVCYWQWGANGIFLAEFVAALLIFIQAGRYLSSDLIGRFRPKMLRSSVGYAVGILPGHFLGYVTPLFTRSYLANVDSLAALGQLAVASRFMLPLMTLGYAFQTAFNPIYFSLRNEGTDEALVKITRIARSVWVASIFCALAGAFLGPQLIQLVLPAKFHDASNLVPILCVGFLAQAMTVLGAEVYYRKKTHLVPVAGAVSVATTVSLTIWLVPIWGEYGLAWATSLGAVMYGLFAAAISHRLIRLPHNWLGLMRASASGLISVLAFYLLPPGNLAWEFCRGLCVMAIFPALLWIMGDEAFREGVAYIHQRARIAR